MDEEMVALRLNPVDSDKELPRQVWFYFGRDGELACIVQSHYAIIEATIDGETSQSTNKYTDTIRLLSTDAGEIQKIMEAQLTR